MDKFQREALSKKGDSITMPYPLRLTEVLKSFKQSRPTQFTFNPNARIYATPISLFLSV